MTKQGYSKKALSSMRASMIKQNPGLTKTQVSTVHKIVKKDIKKVMESKHADTTYLISPTQAAPTNINLLIPPQGLIDQNRIGDRIKIKSIRLRMDFQNYNTAVPADNAYNVNWRVMIVQDKSYNVSATGTQPAGSAQITPSQLLTPDATGNYGVTSQRNVDHLETLTVLYDKVFTTQYNNVSKKFVNIKVPMKYCKKNVQFSNASNIGQVTNSIFLYVVTDVAAVASNPICFYTSRILFTDA